jgi:hypothetical protein
VSKCYSASTEEAALNALAKRDLRVEIYDRLRSEEPYLGDEQVAVRLVLDAVAPLIAARALRDLADEHTTLTPDVLGYKVQVVFTEDILEAAAEAERGFGK